MAVWISFWRNPLKKETEPGHYLAFSTGGATARKGGIKKIAHEITHSHFAGLLIGRKQAQYFPMDLIFASVTSLNQGLNG